MSRAYIVVGLGFGDEGKGLCTDWLARSIENPIVIRFNGGHQAGHTVVTNQGQSHVFSNFGSGSLKGVPTYWSKFCTFSPLSFIKEYDVLTKLGITPLIYIDNLCPVTTHYDIIFNRQQEKARKENLHGSCGVGFGATIERNTTPYKFYAQDLQFPEVCALKLKSIKNYYITKSQNASVFNVNEFDLDEADMRFLKNLEKLEALKQQGAIHFANERSMFSVDTSWSNYIFEGAQGVLLDMDFGFFPHVTRSNTTSKNAQALIHKYLQSRIKSTEIFYVSRCYQTRHGAGPMTNEDHKLSLVNNKSETNVFHEYQGNFRGSPLDTDLLNYAITCDDNFSSDCNKNILITCLDQIEAEQIPFSKQGRIEVGNISTILNTLPSTIQNSYLNYSNCSDGLVLKR